MKLKRVTRFRDWKGRHGNRAAKGCFRALCRLVSSDLDPSKPGPRRPAWLKPTIERQLGHKVIDAWIADGQVSVQMPGSISTAEVTVTFER